MTDDAAIEKKGFGSEDECRMDSTDTVLLEGTAVVFVK